MSVVKKATVPAELAGNSQELAKGTVAVSDLATFQVARSAVPSASLNEEHLVTIAKLSIALCDQIEAADALESILARVTVGLSNMTMDCFQHAMQSNSLAGRELELKHAVKGALALTKVVRAIDDHRGRGKQSVTVGKVNVESGGQAIVGNVNSEAEGDQEPDRSTMSSKKAPR